jgi:hypothetical protein
MNSLAHLSDARTTIVHDSSWILPLCCALCDSGVNLLLVPPKHVALDLNYLHVYICARRWYCTIKWIMSHCKVRVTLKYLDLVQKVLSTMNTLHKTELYTGIVIWKYYDCRSCSYTTKYKSTWCVAYSSRHYTVTLGPICAEIFCQTHIPRVRQIPYSTPP